MLESLVHIGDFVMNDQSKRTWADWWIKVFAVDGLFDADEIRTERIDRAGKHGTRTGKQLYSGKTLTISGEIRARSLGDLRRGQLEFQAATRSLEETTLKWKLWDQVWVQADVRKAQPLVMDEVQSDSRFAREFAIAYYSDSPRVLSIITKTASSLLDVVSTHNRVYGPATDSNNRKVKLYGPDTDGGFEVWKYDASDPTDPFSVVNGGFVETYPVIDVYGPVTDPVVLNLTTNQRLEWEGLTLASDEFIRIYADGQQIFKDDLFEYPVGFKPLLSTPDFYLARGENRIRVQAFSVGAGAKIDVFWQDAFG